MKKNQQENNRIINEIKQQAESEKKRTFLSHIKQRSTKENLQTLKGGIPAFKEELNGFKREQQQNIRNFLTYERVASGATDSPEYYLQLCLSCLIALFGLYMNSPAVIIGAMLVAPLMNPILGFSAGWLWGSARVTWEAVTTLLKGILLVLVLTTGLTLLLPGISITDEMMNRAYPSLFDIVVALCCGLVGAYAFANKKITAALPGAAIAVALLPPLCTVGIGLGMGQWALAGGAALLFTINLISILLASVVVFSLVRLKPETGAQEEQKKVRQRAAGQIVLASLILLIIAVPLGFFMARSIKESRLERAVFTTVGRKVPEEIIFQKRLIQGKDREIKVRLIILENPEDPEWQTRLNKELKELSDEEIQLEVYRLNREL